MGSHPSRTGRQQPALAAAPWPLGSSQPAGGKFWVLLAGTCMQTQHVPGKARDGDPCAGGARPAAPSAQGAAGCYMPCLQGTHPSCSNKSQVNSVSPLRAQNKTRTSAHRPLPQMSRAAARLSATHSRMRTDKRVTHKLHEAVSQSLFQPTLTMSRPFCSWAGLTAELRGTPRFPGRSQEKNSLSPSPPVVPAPTQPLMAPADATQPGGRAGT